jgi:hypothetical protein
MVLKKWGISQLYHWIQKDPIIDYLELYHSDKKYRPSSNYDFESLPSRSSPNVSTNWKQTILNSLEVQCNQSGTRLVNQPQSVQREIEHHTKGISNGYLCLRNEYATIDLILHNQIVSYLPSYREPHPPNDFYTLCFWNTTNIPSLYVQCKVAFAWQLFEKVMMQPARCLLLTPNGILSIDPTKYLSILEEGRQWLSDLHEEGSSWSIDSSQVPDRRLLPNLGRKHIGWDKLKEKLAYQWKEVSLVCHIGSQTRELLHSQQIYSLLDPRIVSLLDKQDQIPMITKQIVQEIQRTKTPLKISHLLDDFAVHSNRRLDVSGVFWTNCQGQGSIPLPVLSFEETIISVDIESVAGVWSDGTKAGDTFIGALVILPSGIIQQYIFFNPSFEKVLAEFYGFLETYQNALLIHYTDADLSVIPKGYRTLDVHPLVREEYEHTQAFRSFGMYKFGLKHVTERLFGDLYSSSTIKNGCECSAALYHAVRLGLSHQEGQTLLSQVEEYNSIDLYALVYLFKTLLSFPNTNKSWRKCIKIKK